MKKLTITARILPDGKPVTVNRQCVASDWRGASVSIGGTKSGLYSRGPAEGD